VAGMFEAPTEAPVARPPVKVNVATVIDPGKLVAANVGRNQEVA
jgi:hypothetical protein